MHFVVEYFLVMNNENERNRKPCPRKISSIISNVLCIFKFELRAYYKY